MQKNHLFRYLLLGILLLAARTGQAQNIDINLLDAINGPSTHGDQTCKFLTESTYPLSIATTAGLFTAGLIRHDSSLKWSAYQLAATQIVAAGAAFVLKRVVNRERPYDKYDFIVRKQKAEPYSFPSGHASIAFATATSLTLQFKKWYIAVPAFVWAGAVGYSRMELGMHYPSDVLGGALVGAGSAWLCYEGNKWLRKKRRTKFSAQ
ncbi:phosphatase PAP2 family protein [Chitinophaga vietnamensis]|uniref:phosphatase PAP2 family protein n=1 Tax=Chitinophaga vietnamensis TaxID=2593957 RepID=UPI0011781FBF|nr:phosphatase PAP2 family protein [Chitinophaga vietnamensis]